MLPSYARKPEEHIAYQVVQSTTHWAFLLVGAVLAVLFNNPKFPNIWSLVLVGFLTIFVFHIGIRIAKGYINQLRWNVLERELINLLVDRGLPDEQKAEKFSDMVRTYHYEWRSPVGAARLTSKVLFELGFFPLLVGILLLLAYLYLRIGDVSVEVKNVVLLIVAVLAVGEVLVFRYESVYLKKVQTHPHIKY